MSRITHTDDASLRNEQLPPTLLSQCRQALVGLDQVATAFRGHESQIRNLIALLKEPSIRDGVGAAQLGEAPTRRLTVAFFCFGKFYVEVEGARVEALGPSKVVRILKFLVQSHGRLCPREMLLEAFWPEIEPEVASNRLRVALYTLRQIFAARANLRDVIAYENGAYGLSPSIDVWVDANEFETLWREGVRFERGGHRTEAAQRYEQAERRYQGDYLEEDLYEEWTLLRRESLRDAYLHLLGQLATWHLEERDYGSCISRCHRLLAEDPYREDACRMLMLCYVAMGQKATALHWYQICAANLRKGLDADPSPETSSLHSRIMAGEVSSDLANRLFGDHSAPQPRLVSS